MFLGIEIGGTKLQLGVGRGDGSELVELQQVQIDPTLGATGILDHIERLGRELLDRQEVTRIGIGFGGPVNVAAGLVTKSHQIAGWDGMPLVDWCERTLGLPTHMDNDCNVAALAESRFGAGRGQRAVFYVTVGTGVGGGLVIDGDLYGSDRPAIAEIGHLRPGPQNDGPDATVESVASGWGIVSVASSRLRQDLGQEAGPQPERRNVTHGRGDESQHASGLWARCHGDLDRLTAEIVASAAGDGEPLAREVMRTATKTLGWAIAQMITLLAPNVVVIGGGVAKMGQAMFLAPLNQEVRRYVFPPLADSFQIVPATLGDLVVVHGALALAADGKKDEGQGRKDEGRRTKDESC